MRSTAHQLEVHCWAAVNTQLGCALPSSVQATRAYLHKEDDVEVALAKAGFKVTKREMTATSFYFSRLLSAQRVQ